MLERFWSIRVYYEDTDSGGVVYHANFLRFFERSRTEWLRELGFEQDRLRNEANLLFAVRAMHIDFVRPARFNQALTVGTRLDRVGKASLHFNQRIFGCSAEPSLPSEISPICEARVRIACLDATAFRPRPVPPEIKEEIVRATR